MYAPPPVPPLPPSEEDQVYRMLLGDDTQVRQWRFDQLLKLGVGGVDAANLTGITDVTSTVRSLIAAGCPPDLAARIVL